jgi:perosamine synthetase
MTDDIAMAAAEIDETDVQAVLSVLRSGRLALGPQAAEFEARLARYAGVKHAISASSGTAALHLIVRSLGLGPGDEVIVPSFTFAASVNAILFEGATPVFIDIEPETKNLDPEQLADLVTDRTKAIMAVDVFGHPAEWDAILTFAKRHALQVVDDSCEGLGSEYNGKRLGGFGTAAAFAFYPNKQITTGEGGMVVTNDSRVAELCRSLRNQGRPVMGQWLEHIRLGFNYRMDELSAALGVSQLERIESFVVERARVANAYTHLLANLDWVATPVVRPHVRMSWFVYVATLARDIDRNYVVRSLEQHGIPSRAYFSPIHLQPYISERFGDLRGTLPVTEDLATRTIALPFHSGLTGDQVERVVDTLRAAVSRAS